MHNFKVLENVISLQKGTLSSTRLFWYSINLKTANELSKLVKFASFDNLGKKSERLIYNLESLKSSNQLKTFKCFTPLRLWVNESVVSKNFG
jgi:hypothetical protein